MYSPVRTPNAMITAALENKKFQGFHVFVEGGGDFKLWRNFMQKSKTRVTICNGCDKVIEATILGNKKGIRCLGIIDRDFRSILCSEDLPSNIFMTDDHDIEMMMCHTDCLGKVLNNYDSSQKIDAYEEAQEAVRDKVLFLTDQIGYLKLLNKRTNLNLILKRQDNDGSIVLPSYEKFLDKHCQYKSNEDMIRYLIQWSESHGNRANMSLEEILQAYIKESETEQDSWQLSNGHDFTYLLAYFVHKEIGCKKKTQQEIESELVLAYENDSFQHTNLFKEMHEWIMTNNNNDSLFSFDIN